MTAGQGIHFELPDQEVELLMFAAGLAYQTEQFEQALTIYKGIAAARPTWSRPVVGLGTALYRLDRTEEAEAAYRKAIEMKSDDQEAQLYLGELIWNERQDRKSAEVHLGKAITIQPKSVFGVRARYILSMIRKEHRAA